MFAVLEYLNLEEGIKLLHTAKADRGIVQSQYSLGLIYARKSLGFLILAWRLHIFIGQQVGGTPVLYVGGGPQLP